MNKEIDFASSDKIKNRQELCIEFYKNILTKDEWPLVVTDESSIYDFTFDDDDLLVSKIFKYYGVKVSQFDLKQPFWKLLDLLNSNRPFVVNLPIIITKNQLFSELKDRLLFPDYFGFNWDALYDCLNDLSWIKQQRVVINHDQILGLDQSDLKIYLEILNEFVINWQKDNLHFIEVKFAPQETLAIKKLLSAGKS